MHRILITEHLDPVCAQWLSARAEVVWCSHEDPSFASQLRLADGLVVRTYTQVNPALLQGAPRLRVVGRAGVGLENIDLPACQQRGIPVVYTPDANTQAVVEYVLALIFDDLRPRPAMPDQLSAAAFHDMRKKHVGRQLSDLTLGILGFGRIGKRLARAAHALGVPFLVHDILPETQLRTAVEFPFEFVSFADLLQRSDVLSIHVDGRRDNRHLINAAALQQMKPDAMIINAARGMLVDSHALAAWARKTAATGGRVVLDVHDPEPPGADYPLFGLPNVKLLPHLASRTDTAMLNMSWVVRDVLAVLEGQQPEYRA